MLNSHQEQAIDTGPTHHTCPAPRPRHRASLSSPLFTCCCLDVPTQQPRDSLLILRSGPRRQTFSPLFLFFITLMLPGKFFLLRQARPVGSVYPRQVTPLRGKPTPRLLPPNPAHTRFSPQTTPQKQLEAVPQTKRPSPFGGRNGRHWLPEKEDHQTSRQRGTGAPSSGPRGRVLLTWEKLSPLRGWHCSSTRSTAPVLFLIFSACWAR